MISIVKAKEEDFQLLADIGRRAFIESHGSSAATADINMYVNEKYTYEMFKEEISDPKNIYHIIYYDKQPAGYSKIIFNVPLQSIINYQLSMFNYYFYDCGFNSKGT